MQFATNFITAYARLDILQMAVIWITKKGNIFFREHFDENNQLHLTTYSVPTGASNVLVKSTSITEIFHFFATHCRVSARREIIWIINEPYREIEINGGSGTVKRLYVFIFMELTAGLGLIFSAFSNILIVFSRKLLFNGFWRFEF